MITIYITTVLIMALLGSVYAYKGVKYYQIYENGYKAIEKANSVSAIRNLKMLQSKALLHSVLYLSAFGLAFLVGLLTVRHLGLYFWG